MRVKTSGIFLLGIACAFAPMHAETSSSDVVVYGGTAAGVIAAVAAAREGSTVTLVEPGRHLGGMASGGLGWTDFGKPEVIGGMSREFFQRVGKKYGDTVAWHHEPHVAESVFNEMAREAGIKIRLETRMKETGGLIKSGAVLTGLISESGDVFQGKVFVDATYEGDLMAKAGVDYTWGREASSQYGESLAGVRARSEKHQFPAGLSPLGSDGKLLPEISAGPRGAVGSGDKKIQAYNFRLCMTDQADNRLPFLKPAGYDPARYALLGRFVNAMIAADATGAVGPGTFMKLDLVHGRKTDTNNNGGFSTDYIGGSWDYPDAGYAARAEIWKQHILYTQGFFWFLQNDPSIPKAFQDKMAAWGLSKDEFTDNGGWPFQLYVRESRRMLGEYVMTQKDIQTDRAKPEGIGMGSYNSDSHNVQRVVNDQGAVENEGDVQVAVNPYEIPYRILTPKRAQATNLLVPVCFSASHTSYSTLRMEPQYMILGHAAGVAAHMAAKTGKPVQEIDVQALRSALKAEKAELGATPVTLADRGSVGLSFGPVSLPASEAGFNLVGRSFRNAAGGSGISYLKTGLRPSSK